MAYQSKDSAVLNSQLKVQELVIKANSPFLTVVGSDLVLNVQETVLEVRACLKQVAAGTLTGIACTIASGNIVITGESAAVSTTTYIVKYVVAE